MYNNNNKRSQQFIIDNYLDVKTEHDATKTIQMVNYNHHLRYTSLNFTYMDESNPLTKSPTIIGFGGMFQFVTVTNDLIYLDLDPSMNELQEKTFVWKTLQLESKENAPPPGTFVKIIYNKYLQNIIIWDSYPRIVLYCFDLNKLKWLKPIYLEGTYYGVEPLMTNCQFNLDEFICFISKESLIRIHWENIKKFQQYPTLNKLNVEILPVNGRDEYQPVLLTLQNKQENNNNNNLQNTTNAHYIFILDKERVEGNNVFDQYSLLVSDNNNIYLKVLQTNDNLKSKVKENKLIVQKDINLPANLYTPIIHKCITTLPNDEHILQFKNNKKFHYNSCNNTINCDSILFSYYLLNIKAFLFFEYNLQKNELIRIHHNYLAFPLITRNGVFKPYMTSFINKKGERMAIYLSNQKTLYLMKLDYMNPIFCFEKLMKDEYTDIDIN